MAGLPHFDYRPKMLEYKNTLDKISEICRDPHMSERDKLINIRKLTQEKNNNGSK